MRLAVVDERSNVLIAWDSAEIAQRAVAHLAAHKAVMEHELQRAYEGAKRPAVAPGKKLWRRRRRPTPVLAYSAMALLEEALPGQSVIELSIEQALRDLCIRTARL